MKMDDKGFTLVEVLAGFSLLVVLMVSFVHIINLSAKLTKAAVDAQNDTTDFYERYYSGENYYVISGGQKKEAFRYPSNNTVTQYNETTGKNEAMKINIKEVTSDYFDGTTTLEYNLSKVKLKIIENLRDTDASRTVIYRYVRE
ncbi:MAG: prepilin-type N-terminal cleavage/methylation domain-containing protein [Lachnospiraceae bacterium]|nr:prepilin-type N-terminal cleavage/methylation domain-containing protein [Lachnospiraceae bacterium]